MFLRSFLNPLIRLTDPPHLLTAPKSSLHNHHQVHARMNGAIQVEGPSRREWSNGLAAATATDLHVLHGWRAILLHGLRVSIHPTAVGNDMGYRGIVSQRDGAALADGDR